MKKLLAIILSFVVLNSFAQSNDPWIQVGLSTSGDKWYIHLPTFITNDNRTEVYGWLKREIHSKVQKHDLLIEELEPGEIPSVAVLYKVDCTSKKYSGLAIVQFNQNNKVRGKKTIENPADLTFKDMSAVSSLCEAANIFLDEKRKLQKDSPKAKLLNV